VTGSVWQERPYTLKLEGAGAGGYQTIMLVGIQDPEVLGRLDEFHDKMLAALNHRVKTTIGEARATSTSRCGSMAGTRFPATSPGGAPVPREVGVLFVATAATQEMATQIAKACNAWFFHFPIVEDEELPSYGFAFTPADIERGAVYEFKLNHVVEIDDPMALVRTTWIDLKKKEDGVMTTVKDVCRHVRSKNAGPYWVTFDLFFDGPESFAKYQDSPALGPPLFERLFGADPTLVRRYPVPDLNVVKISYARTAPQGGMVERDMHCGQQFVRLLDVRLD